MFAIVRSSFVSMVIGPRARPVASAANSSRLIAWRTAGALTSGAFTTTLAGSALPGNACCMRSYVFTTSRDFGNVSGPGVAIRS